MQVSHYHQYIIVLFHLCNKCSIAQTFDQIVPGEESFRICVETFDFSLLEEKLCEPFSFSVGFDGEWLLSLLPLANLWVDR